MLSKLQRSFCKNYFSTRLQQEMGTRRATKINAEEEQKCAEGELMTYKIGHAETTWSFGMFQRAVKKVCV